MDVSLGFVLEAARVRLAPLTPEVAGYVVLLALQAIEGRPGRVAPANVRLGEDGDIRVTGCPLVDEVEAESSLRELLGGLLAVCSSPAPTMAAVARRPGGAGLGELAAELMAALIPVNHAAARRALARLHRETRRARELAAEAAGAAALAQPSERPPAAPPALAAAAPAGGPPQRAPVSPRLRGSAAAQKDGAAEREPEEREPGGPGAAEGEPGEREPDGPGAAEGEPNERESGEPGPGGREPGEREPAAAGSLGTADLPPPRESEPPSEYRSDVDQLLASFLAPARTREAMSRALRKMAGLPEPPPRRRGK